LKSIAIFVVITFFLITAQGTAADPPGDFHLRAGLGYDFVSQEYFLDSVRHTGSDSALISTLLKKDYLDDKKGLAYFKYDPHLKGKYMLEGGWEQTPEVFRGIGNGHILVAGDKNRLEASGHFEAKRRFKGIPDIGEELTAWDGRISLARKFSKSLQVKARGFGETINFDSTGSLIFDYHRWRGDVGIDFFTPNYSNFYLICGAERRDVPDSTDLGYNAVRGVVGFMGYFLGSDLSTEFSLESKKFGGSQNPNDYSLYSFYSNSRIPLGQVYYFKPDISLDYFNYRNDQAVNFDYLLGRGTLAVGRELGNVSLYGGPRLELLSVYSAISGENYLEYGLAVNLDYYLTRKLFLLFENQIGRRSYENAASFYTSFNFERLSLIGNLKVWRYLTFDILFSGEWEWHTVHSDDTRLFLLSTSLTYSF
jgi:hypothetical protein